MSAATITQEIPVRDTMPISFTLPLSATTEVLVTDGVPLNIPATFTLPGGGGQIIGSVTLELPAVNLNVLSEIARRISSTKMSASSFCVSGSKITNSSPP